jgi:hypothetical protein
LPIWVQFLLLVQTIFSNAQPDIQTAVSFVDSSVFYTYGEQVTFQVKIETQDEIEDISIFIQVEDGDTQLIDIWPDENGVIHYQYDLDTNALRPFSRVYFWYRGKLISGDDFTSAIYGFDYFDNRFSWENIQSEKFSIYWYNDDLSLGQTLLNTANTGLLSAQSITATDLSIAPIRVYLYDSAVDLQSALQLGNSSWIGGHASPDLGLVLISAAPGPDRTLELERQVPHEITHILQYQITGSAYSQVPPWLIEGMASISELYPNPDYEQALINAIEQNNLIAMSSICHNFPQDTSEIFLAYAQSASFVGFLHSNYGADGLQSLLKAYSNGIGCEEGPTAVFDKPLTALEAQWKQETLGIKTGKLAYQNLLPFGLLAALILIPILLSTTFKWPGRR